MFGAKEKADVVAVADIGSGSASVAIMRVSKSGASVVLTQHRTELPFEKRTEAQTTVQIIVALADAAHKAHAAYQKTMNAPVRALYVIVRGPWAQTSIFEGKESFDHDTKITESVLDAIGQKAVVSQESDNESSFEKTIVKVELNGYPTATPLRKEARFLRLAVLESRVYSDFKSAAEHTLGVAFPGTPAAWRSHTRALLALLSLVAPRLAVSSPHIDARNCFVVDVSSTATSLITIRKDVAVAQEELALGSVSVAQKIAGDNLPEETLALLQTLESDACSTQECERLTKALALAEPEFTRTFGEVFAKMAAQRRLPNTLFLIAHENLLPWLSQFFARIDFAPFSTTTLPFSVVPLTAKDLGHEVISAGTFDDTSLAIACALVHTEASRV